METLLLLLLLRKRLSVAVFEQLSPVFQKNFSDDGGVFTVVSGVRGPHAERDPRYAQSHEEVRGHGRCVPTSLPSPSSVSQNKPVSVVGTTYSRGKPA